MMFRTAIVSLVITVLFASTGSAQGLVLKTLELPARSPQQAAFEQAAGKPVRDSRLNGFLIGFAIGAVPGIVLGVAFNSYCNDEGSGCPIVIPIAGGLFGLAGGGIGFAIDSAIHQSPTFGRPRPSPSARFSFRF